MECKVQRISAFRTDRMTPESVLPGQLKQTILEKLLLLCLVSASAGEDSDFCGGQELSDRRHRTPGLHCCWH